MSQGLASVHGGLAGLPGRRPRARASRIRALILLLAVWVRFGPADARARTIDVDPGCNERGVAVICDGGQDSIVLEPIAVGLRDDEGGGAAAASGADLGSDVQELSLGPDRVVSDRDRAGFVLGAESGMSRWLRGAIETAAAAGELNGVGMMSLLGRHDRERIGRVERAARAESRLRQEGRVAKPRSGLRIQEPPPEDAAAGPESLRALQVRASILQARRGFDLAGCSEPAAAPRGEFHRMRCYIQDDQSDGERAMRVVRAEGR